MSAQDIPVAKGALDTQSMYRVTADLPEYLETSANEAKGMKGLPSRNDVENIVVLGMGGSGVAGEVLRAYGASTLDVPVILTDGYELPAFVGPKSLVFATSFSGNTEETLEATAVAEKKGAQLIAITSGGALGARASELGLVRYNLPGSIPQPRGGLGAMVGPLLICCEEIGLLPGAGKAIDAAVAQMRIRRESLISSAGGMGFEIATRLGRTFPVVYGAEGLGGVAARRWKTQVNENAKAPAFFAVQPELSHNEICGYGQSGDVTRQILSLVILRSDFEPPRVDPRFALLDTWLRETVADVIEVHGEGDGPLAQFFDLVYIGDFVSLHLAVKEGIDPGPVPLLVQLKDELGRIPVN